MDTANSIRSALEQVTALRRQAQSEPAPAEALARLHALSGNLDFEMGQHRLALTAGLGKLQGFPEAGLATSAQLARKPDGLTGFLALIASREQRLIDPWFDGDPVASETDSARLLEQARRLDTVAPSGPATAQSHARR